jgi:hypothetical protein
MFSREEGVFPAGEKRGAAAGIDGGDAGVQVRGMSLLEKPIPVCTVCETRPAEGRCRVARDGVALPGWFDGTWLEGAFVLPDGCLVLVLSEGSAYDAGLHIYLLSPPGEVLDAVESSAVMVPGHFRLDAAAGGRLEFAFYTNDRRYALSRLPVPVLRFRLQQGWRYKSKLRRHLLTLTQLPGHE